MILDNSCPFELVGGKETIMSQLLHRPVLVLLAIMASLISSSCQGSLHLGSIRIGEVRIGMIGTNQPGEISYNFSTFKGFESRQFQAEADQILELDYSVSLEKGTLDILLEDPDRVVVWQNSFAGAQEEKITYKIENSGEHTIYVQADQAGGSFKIIWELK
jgi:hypothetical protein